MALMSNYDVRIALSRVAEARALRRDVAFDLAPSITAGGGYTETRVAREQTLAGAPRSTEFYDAGFDAFWELDFFGRVRRGLEASTARARCRRGGRSATLWSSSPPKSRAPISSCAAFSSSSTSRGATS